MKEALLKLLKRPIGIWILVVWCAVQAVAGVFLGLGLHGMRGTAAWLFVAVQVAFIAGLLFPLTPARHFVVTYVALQILAVGTAVWGIVFVSIAWGLRRSDLPLVAPVAVYQLFLAWAFMYIWHPGVQEYLKRQLVAPAD
jgi:hypothetical protein